MLQQYEVLHQRLKLFVPQGEEMGGFHGRLTGFSCGVKHLCLPTSSVDAITGHSEYAWDGQLST